MDGIDDTDVCKKEDLDNVSSIEIHTKGYESENDDTNEMRRQHSDDCDEICEKPRLNEVTSEQQIVKSPSDDLENHIENKEEEILQDFKEEHDETAFGQKIPAEQIPEVKKRGWLCCKLLIILSTTIIWLSFLVYCYLYLTTVCVPVEVFHYCLTYPKDLQNLISFLL